jgi:hypothetical protein
MKLGSNVMQVEAVSSSHFKFSVINNTDKAVIRIFEVGEMYTFVKFCMVIDVGKYETFSDLSKIM